jgi:hypothetical protein
VLIILSLHSTLVFNLFKYVIRNPISLLTYELIQAYYDSVPSLTARQVYGLATTSLERLLGVKGIDPETAGLVAFEGGSAFNLSSKVVAVISAQRGQVEIL